MFQFKQSETNGVRRRIFFYASSAADGYTPVTTGLSTATLVEVTKNGVMAATIVLNPTFTHISNGLWYHELSQVLLDTVGIITVTITDAVMRPVQAVGYVYSGDPLTSSTPPTAADIWSYTNRTLTGAVSVSGNVTVGGFTAGAISSSAFANSAINLRLASDPIASSARFTTYDSFSGYPLLSQTAQHQVSITGSHHAAADVHEFQPSVITDTATDATFVNELVDAMWDEIASGHLIAGSFGAIMDTLRKGNYVVDGTVTSSVIPTPTEFSTNVVALDGTYDHQTVLFLTGDLAGESKPSLTSSQANGLFTMEEAFSGIPQTGDQFVILPTHVHAVSAIADGLLNRLLDSSGNSEDVFNERTVRSALRAMRNKVMVDSGTMAVYKEDDTTAAWEGTVSNTANVTVNPDGGSS